jgi:hypothetical protein
VRAQPLDEIERRRRCATSTREAFEAAERLVGIASSLVPRT